MTDWAGLLTTVGGGGGVLTGLLGGVYGYRNRQANYAQASANISRDVAGDLRAENAELKGDIQEVDKKVDQLRADIIDLKQVLLFAILRLERHGEDTTDIRAALNRPGV